MPPRQRMLAGLVLALGLVVLVAGVSVRGTSPRTSTAQAGDQPWQIALPLVLAVPGAGHWPGPLTPAPPTVMPRPTGTPTQTATASATATPGATGATPTTRPSPTPTRPSRDAATVGLFSLSSDLTVLLLGETADAPTRRFHLGPGHTAFSRTWPVAGDFDGDGLDTVALYDGRAASFMILAANAADAHQERVAFGTPVVPVDDRRAVYALAGDFDGDGIDSIGLFDPTSNTFSLRNSNTSGPADLEFVYGIGPVWPLVGDWDGDGVDTVGVVVTSTGVAYLRNDNSTGPADLTVDTGHPGLTPLAGDFDGDGSDTVGMYDHATKTFYLRDAHQEPSHVREVVLDVPSGFWVPLAGRWDTRGETGEGTGFAWPVASPEEVHMDADMLSRGLRRAAQVENLHSLLVVRHGKLAAEAYFSGYDSSVANCLKSASKSVLSALYGLAIEDGSIAGPEQPIAAHLPQYYSSDIDPKLGRITIYNLLTMTAGQQWSDATNLGPMIASDDWVGYVAGRRFLAEPGKRWAYSTGLTHVASALLEEATGVSTRQYAQQKLFEPLGISVTRWDHDPHGRDFGGAEVWMRPRDMARFGQLYLRGGTLDGVRILDPDWVALSTRKHVTASRDYDYGMWWWRDAFAGHDTYFAWGYGGQFVFVVEDLDMVVAATSAWFLEPAASTHQEVFEILSDYILPAAHSAQTADE